MAPCPLIGSDQPAHWHLDAARGPSTPSLDHLVGAGEQRGRHVEAARLRSLEVDRQLVLGWGLHRQIGWLFASENAVDIAGRLPILVDNVWSIRHQPSPGGEQSQWIHCRQPVPSSEFNDQLTLSDRPGSSSYD